MGLSVEQFLLVADLLPEPTLLVSTEGRIHAANRAVSKRLHGWPRELIGQRLPDLVTDARAEVIRYLQMCSRTRDLLPGSLILLCQEGERLPCRCNGAVLIPRSERAPALVQLRLLPKAEAPSQFILLNQRINALTMEIAARKRAEADLQRRQAEVEALNVRLERAIAETHHRVKNNLQAVISLLEMQKEDAVDGLLPVHSLNESMLQIKTIALVHDVLSHDRPLGEVDAQIVLSKLVELLAVSLRSGGDSVSIYLQAESVWLSTHIATALALVVNELISNGHKHGHPSERKQGNDGIYVHFLLQGSEVVLAVEDNGPGFPPDFDVTKHANLGLALVQSLVENDLRGCLAFGSMAPSSAHDKPTGGKVSVRFPAPPRSE